jgi:hypothetical protein
MKGSIEGRNGGKEKKTNFRINRTFVIFIMLVLKACMHNV